MRVFNPTRAADGYERDGSVVETNTEDLPFLVDSVVRRARGRRARASQRVLHPIVGIERDGDGRITAVLHPRDAATRESVMHFDLDRRLAGEALEELEATVRHVLEDVRRAVLDFPAMADRARRMIQLAGAGAARYPDDEVDETVAFLEWLLQDHFIFLGYREYRIAEDTISRRPGLRPGHPRRRGLAPPSRARSRSPACRTACASARPAGDLLIVSKTNRLSPVHRRVRMDYVGVRARRADGPDRRRGADARPVHHQGLRRAGHRRRRCCTASCARSCATRT